MDPFMKLLVVAAVMEGFLVVFYPFILAAKEQAAAASWLLRLGVLRGRRDLRLAKRRRTSQIASCEAMEFITEQPTRQPLRVAEKRGREGGLIELDADLCIENKQPVVTRRHKCSACGCLFNPEALTVLGTDGATGRPLEVCMGCEQLFQVEA